MQTATYYSREITMPKNKREGLQNFIQMIINCEEAGDHGEALLKAVDLLQDVSSGIYDDAMNDIVKKISEDKSIREKHQAEIAKAYKQGLEQGRSDEQARIRHILGI